MSPAPVASPFATETVTQTAMSNTRSDATLLLADGSCFQGRGLGPPTAVGGELVFTTAMTGYQEALTDPSYRGQILLFTYPLIGNYGVAPGRAQSDRVHARAVVLATLSSASPEQRSLASYLTAHNVPTIYSVDTRAIATAVRTHGTMPAALHLHPVTATPALHALETTLLGQSYDTVDFVSEATVDAPAIYGSGRRTIALLDCGNKRDVVQELLARDCRVVVLPAHTDTDSILALEPDGLIISNGPGNPATQGDIIVTIQQLAGRIPLLGICLGHQLLALAAGGRTYKMAFGHRGANQPVQDCASGRAFITTQNHGFAVDESALPGDMVVSHRNLNDGTVEGLQHRTLPLRSVQFHPEGAPGPRDGGTELDNWLETLP